MSLQNDNVKVVRNNGEAKIKIKNRGSPTSWFIRTALFILVLRFSYIMITGHSNGQDLVMKANEKYLVKIRNNQNEERYMTEMVKF